MNHNRTIFTGDNLDVMRGLDTDIADLIYLDPPFNSKRDYESPIKGTLETGKFKDTWTLDDVKLELHGELSERNPALYQIIDAAGFTHSAGMKAYLIMMAVRLLEMKRVLKPTGSIYLHCDPTASHYLKAVMDAVFGRDNFRNEITWKRYRGRVWPRRNPATSLTCGIIADTILFYAGEGATWKFNVRHALGRQAVRVRNGVRTRRLPLPGYE